jgi:hypothetical protein
MHGSFRSREIFTDNWKAEMDDNTALATDNLDAALIRRGTTRLLHSLGFASVPELPLRSGRRADLVAVGRAGELLIVEIKSSVTDFRSDRKWPEYRAHCDRLLFAVTSRFPEELIPPEIGLIVADAYGGTLVRKGEFRPIAPATRKAILLSIARSSSVRLATALDPSLGALESGTR